MEDITKTLDPTVSQGAPEAPATRPVDNPAPPAPVPATADPGADMRALAAKAAVNPALVEFPADPWGFTTELRKAGLKAASNVTGQKDKNVILLGTLMVLMGHVKNRYLLDQAAFEKLKQDQLDTMEEAEKYTRQFGKPYNPEDAVRNALNVIQQAKDSGQFKSLVG